MIHSEPTLVIMAAGLGSRYGSLKQIDQIGPSGERIIDYSLYDAAKAGFKNVVYVIREYFSDEFKEVILDKIPSNINASYVFQELDTLVDISKINSDRTKPWGTGNALLSVASIVNSPFLVINADDFYGQESYEIACQFLNNQDVKSFNYALVGFELGNTMTEYGSVSRGICSLDKNEYLESVVERTKIKWDDNLIVYENEEDNWKEVKSNTIVSMNMFAFMPTIFEEGKKLFNDFLIKNKNDIKAEFYLPKIVDELIKSQKAKVKVLRTPEQWFGLTYKEDKPIVREKILDLINKGIYPAKLW